MSHPDKKSTGEKIAKELRDFFGIHARQKTTPEMKARIARIKAHERAVYASKYGQRKKVEKDKKVRSGTYSHDPMSGGIEMVSGDMYKMPDSHRAAMAATGRLRVDGKWRELKYFNLTSRSITRIGTAEEITDWLDSESTTALTFNLEQDMWDLAFDCDTGSYDLTIEIGVSDLRPGHEVQAKYLGGKTQVINEVVKAVGTTAGSVAGGMISEHVNPSIPGAKPTTGEMAKDAVDAAEGFAEQVAEHAPKGKRKAEAPVLDLASAKKNLTLKVELYGTANLGKLKDQKVHVSHSWGKGDLRTGQIEAMGQACDRYFLFLGDVADEVNRMVNTLFRKLEVEGVAI